MNYRFDTRHLSGQQQAIIRNNVEENKRLRQKSIDNTEDVKHFVADWFYVSDERVGTSYGTKEIKQGEKLQRVSDLQNSAMYLSSQFGDLKNTVWSYMLTDIFIVQQGVFKWNEKSQSFKKVADKHSGISDPTPLNS